MSSDGDFDIDFEWSQQFLPHQAEVAQRALRVDVAPLEEDQRRNTDLILTSAMALRSGQRLTISARVRRFEERDKRLHPRNVPYARQFTIRDRRPSGYETEMDKLRLGYGDMFVYGFQSAPGSDRMYPWFVGNLHVLRDWTEQGGHPSEKGRNKGPRGSTFAVFDLSSMPLGFILASDGIAVGRCEFCGQNGADTFYYEIKDWAERESASQPQWPLHWRCCPLAAQERRCVACFRPRADRIDAGLGGLSCP